MLSIHRRSASSPLRTKQLLAALASFVLSVAAAFAGPPQEPSRSPAGDQAPSPRRAADDRIAGELRAVLAEVAIFEGIELDVSNGVVELRGSVPNPEAGEQAEAVARALEGVIFVENLVELVTPASSSDTATEDDAAEASRLDSRIEDRLKSILAQIDDLANVEVSVVAGVVRLRGEVLDGASVEKAEKLAASTDGVVYVDNELAESTDLGDKLLPNVERMTQFVRNAIAMLPLFVVAAVLVAVFVLLGRAISNREQLIAHLSSNVLIRNILQQAIRTFFLVVGLFLALEILDATALVGAVLGTAGIVSLALGLAFRDIAENYLASIILSIRRPFQSKDVVEIDGHAGTVIRMTTRETALMSFDGNHVLLPNSTVFKSQITNYTRSAKRRFSVDVGLGTDVDLRPALDAGVEVLRAMPGVVEDPAPRGWIKKLGDSTVDVSFVGWIDQRASDFTKVKSEATRLIKEELDHRGISMPNPIYEVDLRSESKLSSEASKETPPRRPKPRPAKAADLTRDTEIEEQIEDDVARSEEATLL